MTVPLYPHQAEINERVRDAMRQGHKSVLLAAATGIGKSQMAAAKILQSQQKGKKSAFVVPKRDLIRQMTTKFSEFNISHSFVAAGYPFNPYAQTHICTHGSLVNRLESISPDLLVIDETHWGSNILDKIINHYKAKGAWIIGLSASPERLDGKGLGMWYSALVEGPSIKWLIDNGYLSQYRMFAPHTPDLTGVKTVAGDYANNALSEIMQDAVLIGNAVTHYKAHALGMTNVAFCTSIKHAEMTAQAFNDAGISAQSIDGSMIDAQRKAIIQAFARKEILSLTSVDLLHTGFDLALHAGRDVTVESISDMRPTQSLALQLQKWGRCLRKKERPALIFDHAGNWQRHNLPDSDREWSLHGRKKKDNGGERAIPVRQCAGGWRDGPGEGQEMPACYFTHAPSNRCPNCGAYYEVASREVEQIDGVLEEIDREKVRRQLRMEQGMCKTLDELVAYGIKTGKKNPEGWAKHVFNSRR